MTDTIELTISTADGPRTVTAHVTETPGLAVHQVGDHPYWVVTHMQSGMEITGARRRSLPDALRVAEDLAVMGDWTFDYTADDAKAGVPVPVDAGEVLRICQKG